LRCKAISFNYIIFILQMMNNDDIYINEDMQDFEDEELDVDT
jgi:hypothetical protein